MQECVGEGMQYLEESAAKIESFEGRIPWMYLDSAGNVTVGVGKELANVLAAQALPFRTIQGSPATMDEVAQEFERVKAMEKDHLATFYVASTSLTLQNPDIEGILFSGVCESYHQLRQSFLHFDSWPVTARQGAIDMLYNLGYKKFMAYHNLIEGLMTENWPVCARECGRNVDQAAFAARNYWTRTCFLNAEIEVAEAQPQLLHKQAS